LSLLVEIPLDNAVATRCWESSSEFRLVVFDGQTPTSVDDGVVYHPSGGETWRFKVDKEEDVQLWIDAIAKATKRVGGR
jgi:hypothetical protein